MKQRFYKVQLCEGLTPAKSPGVFLPHWFFHLRWLNGRVALTSETYTRKAIARKFAKQFHAGFASGLGSAVKFEDLT